MVVDFRDLIEREIERRGWTKYRLGKELEARGIVQMQRLYSYLRGDSNLRLPDLEKILDFLGFRVEPPSE